MENWLRTDEQVEAASALEMSTEAAAQIERDMYRWHWVILGLHSALQGFMVIALRGGDGLAPLQDDIADQWLKAYRANEQPPAEKLDSFLNLYSKIKGPRMQQYMDSVTFQPQGSQGWSVKKLNRLRNDFVHFLPRGWSVEVSGLPQICLDCVAIVEFLGWKSGNVRWRDAIIESRAKRALEELRASLDSLASRYSGTAA